MNHESSPELSRQQKYNDLLLAVAEIITNNEYGRPIVYEYSGVYFGLVTESDTAASDGLDSFVIERLTTVPKGYRFANKLIYKFLPEHKNIVAIEYEANSRLHAERSSKKREGFADDSELEILYRTFSGDGIRIDDKAEADLIIKKHQKYMRKDFGENFGYEGGKLRSFLGWIASGFKQY